MFNVAAKSNMKHESRNTAAAIMTHAVSTFTKFKWQLTHQVLYHPHTQTQSKKVRHVVVAVTLRIITMP